MYLNDSVNFFVQEKEDDRLYTITFALAVGMDVLQSLRIPVLAIIWPWLRLCFVKYAWEYVLVVLYHWGERIRSHYVGNVISMFHFLNFVFPPVSVHIQTLTVPMSKNVVR